MNAVRWLALCLLLTGIMGCGAEQPEGPKRVARPSGESTGSAPPAGASAMPVTAPPRRIATH